MQPCADAAKVLYERRLVIGLHLIHRCCWSWSCVFPCWRKAFLKISVDSALAPQFNLYAARCFRRRWWPSRAYFSLSFSLTVLPLSFHTLCLCLFLASCLYLRLLLSVVILLIMYPLVFSSEQRSIRNPSWSKKINSLCRAGGLSSFILPALLSCSHRQPFFFEFLRWLRSSLRQK